MKRALFLLAACGHPAPTSAPHAAAPDAGAATSDEERTAAIEQAMDTLYPVAHQCWAAAAVDDFHLAGDVKLLIDVGADGKAKADVQEDTTHDDVLTGCLEKVAEAYAWPPPMHSASTMLPFSFTAPDGQNVIDRRLVPEVSDGARVLMDVKNTGDGVASMFELTVPAGKTLPPTRSLRTELWMYLDDPADTSVPKASEDVPVVLAPGTPRAPAAGATPLHILIVSVPGGVEDATRSAGVLPSQPARLTDRPTAAAANLDATVVGATSAAPGATTLLYDFSGNATLTVDGVAMPLTATSVAQIPAGVAFSMDDSGSLSALRILIHG